MKSFNWICFDLTLIKLRSHIISQNQNKIKTKKKKNDHKIKAHQLTKHQMHYKLCFDLCANDRPFEKNFYCTCTFSTDRPTDRSFEFDWTFIQTIEYLANLMSLSRTVVCSSSTCIVVYGTVLCTRNSVSNMKYNSQAIS